MTDKLEPMVEKIARIINPTAFQSHEGMIAHCVASGDDEETARRYADNTYGPQCAEARRVAALAIEASSHGPILEALEEARRALASQYETARAAPAGWRTKLLGEAVLGAISNLDAALALSKGRVSG